MCEYQLTAEREGHAKATGFVRASCRFNQLASEDTTLIEGTVLEPPQGDYQIIHFSDSSFLRDDQSIPFTNSSFYSASELFPHLV